MAVNQKKINCTSCKKKSSCFNILRKADHKFIDANRLEIKFKKGEIICKQGAFASNIMFIYSGLVKSYLETENDKHVVLNILPAEKMIGLSALFGNNVFLHSASAVEDCVICSIDIKTFENYCNSNGAFASEVIKTLNSFCTENYDRYICITQKQMDGRLADALLYLTNNIYKNRSFSMTLSRNDLAEMANMSPESITRILTKFKKDKLIKITGKQYEIKNYERLLKISQLE
ncbi:MAG: Crp/Fnr family transcriptional regulator [Bacteroidales bacterium]|nr:Crp/Fnr family transcriptional regulator [Bacteroidales bacterium]MCF8389610.1 Crp/Fnr family transcriptional regulator [Bacteroidales bacterium]